MSRAALATVDGGKRVPREGRADAGALVGVLVGVVVGALVGALVGARVGFGEVGAVREGFARVDVAGKSTGSCKSDKGESRDDFELHIVLLLL
jgi:ADP-ribosylglycohydrolase